MKAVRYHGPEQKFELEQVDRPEPAAGEVLVRVTAAGMCHTELHFKSGLLDLGVAPVTMGHEVVGQIEAVGSEVDAERVGERVIVYYYRGCGTCAYCRRGEENLCPQPKDQYGFVSDGGYAEFAAVPARNAVPLPDAISDVDAAPIGCSVTTAVHAANKADLGFGEWAVVYGTGSIGLVLTQLIAAKGARPIAVSRTPAKLNKARELGAEAVVNATEEDAAARIQEITGGGADVVFECVGTDETMQAAAAALGRKGRLVFIGYSEDALTIHPLQLVVFEQEIRASVGATLDDLYESIDLVARGVVRPVIDHTLPLEDYQQGLDQMASGEVIGKVVLTPSGDAA